MDIVDDFAQPDDTLALFSMVFGIEDSETASWFDPILTRDNPVFVDPFLLDICEEPEFDGASEQVFNHFRYLFEMLALDPLADTRRLLRFPEFKEACLGYTKDGIDGAGSGPDRAVAMRTAMGNAIRAGITESPRHFEELSLLAPRIANDLISDITLRILAGRFMAYTARIARELGLLVAQRRIDSYRAEADGTIRPRPYVADLPVNPHTANGLGIVLVPKLVLRELPTINKGSFEDYLYAVHPEDLRRDFNIEVKRHLARRIIEIANARPDWVRAYTEYEDQRDPSPYDFHRDPRSVGTSRKYFYLQALRSPALQPPVDADGVLDFVLGITNVFKIEIEQNSGYRFLYKDAECTLPKREEAVQDLYAMVARGMCKQAGVYMTREANAGSGPVDFVFTMGYAATVLLETKLISNSDLWNGVGGQLPAYLRGHDALMGLIVGVAFTDNEVESVRYTALTDFARQVGAELGFTVRGERIDARRRATPPSDRPTEVAPPTAPRGPRRRD